LIDLWTANLAATDPNRRDLEAGGPTNRDKGAPRTAVLTVLA